MTYLYLLHLPHHLRAAIMISSVQSPNSWHRTKKHGIYKLDRERERERARASPTYWSILQMPAMSGTQSLGPSLAASQGLCWQQLGIRSPRHITNARCPKMGCGPPIWQLSHQAKPCLLRRVLRGFSIVFKRSQHQNEQLGHKTLKLFNLYLVYHNIDFSI